MFNNLKPLPQQLLVTFITLHLRELLRFVIYLDTLVLRTSPTLLTDRWQWWQLWLVNNRRQWRLGGPSFLEIFEWLLSFDCFLPKSWTFGRLAVPFFREDFRLLVACLTAQGVSVNDVSQDIVFAVSFKNNIHLEFILFTLLAFLLSEFVEFV